jgi:hypothetical protein
MAHPYPKQHFRDRGFDDPKSDDALPRNSREVIFAAWCEDIDNQRVFKGGCAVFHSAPDNERISGPKFKYFPLAGNLQVAMDNVHNLIVRMAVQRPDPPFCHLVLREK